ncbi:alpha/beta hydrolase family protein [Agaribacter flavus]|uniref:Alpha/beta hydrolase family protein n=1 Tax=Agaribacter flavus TaxID=1902781 RepID=A0ABV7FQF7_9ALTE
MKNAKTIILFTFALFTCHSLYAEEIPLEAFSNLPKYQQVSISQTGKRIAYVENYQAPQKLSVLTTFNLENQKRKLLLQSDNVEVKINWFEWANDDVLLVSAKYETKQRLQRYYQTRLFSIDVSAKEPKTKYLLKPSSGFNQQDFVSQFQDNVIDFLPDDKDHILMAVDRDVHAMPSVFRVNINTGRKKRVERAKMSIRDWTTDQQHVVRVGYAYDYDSGDTTYYHRFGKKDDFEALFEFNTFEDKPTHVLGFGLDPNILYYSAYRGDYRAIYKLSLDTKQSELVHAYDDKDVSGGLIYSRKTRDVIGVYDRYALYGRHYFDESAYKLNRGLEKIFEGSQAYVTDMSSDEKQYIALIEADYKAPIYYFGDRNKKILQPILEKYPMLYEVPLSHHERVTYEARDGVKIEGYLSLPLTGEAPYPTVLHPHGGPGARDVDGFDPWVSYMTNRGYAVFRPNFRGSTGYGYEFAQAQMGRWGLEMQDDLSDAALWLVEGGIADPDKMCIFGASYGGYAAMMASVKTPDLFTCAVSFAGVSDLKQLRKVQRRFLGGSVVADNQIGKKSKDLKSRSPLHGVEKIKIPLLIMHGSEDIIVRVNQSRVFVDELEDQNKDFKYVEFENGDHYLSIQENRTAFFEELDSFLAEHLGTPKP